MNRRSEEPLHNRKAVETVESTDVHYIGLTDLKKNKRALGRHQDLADIENLGGDAG